MRWSWCAFHWVLERFLDRCLLTMMISSSRTSIVCMMRIEGAVTIGQMMRCNSKVDLRKNEAVRVLIGKVNPLIALAVVVDYSQRRVRQVVSTALTQNRGQQMLHKRTLADVLTSGEADNQES